MAATAAQIAQLRRMCGLASDDATYTDQVLAWYIESYPLADEWGMLPYRRDASTTPAGQTANESWVSTYDLAAAAADVWEERAAGYAGQYDVNADGASRTLSQQYEHAAGRARYWRSRRSAKSVRTHTVPREVNDEPDFQ
jgi:hypothetical protein